MFCWTSRVFITCLRATGGDLGFGTFGEDPGTGQGKMKMKMQGSEMYKFICVQTHNTSFQNLQTVLQRTGGKALLRRNVTHLETRCGGSVQGTARGRPPPPRICNTGANYFLRKSCVSGAPRQSGEGKNFCSLSFSGVSSQKHSVKNFKGTSTTDPEGGQRGKHESDLGTLGPSSSFSQKEMQF